MPHWCHDGFYPLAASNTRSNCATSRLRRKSRVALPGELCTTMPKYFWYEVHRAAWFRQLNLRAAAFARAAEVIEAVQSEPRGIRKRIERYSSRRCGGWNKKATGYSAWQNTGNEKNTTPHENIYLFLWQYVKYSLHEKKLIYLIRNQQVAGSIPAVAPIFIGHDA